MRMPLKFAGSVAGAALLLTSAGPAAARGWGWGSPYYRHYHRGSDAGAVIGAIAAIGIVAAIASAASSNNRAAPAPRYDGPPPPPIGGSGYEDRGYEEQGYVGPAPSDAPQYDGRNAAPTYDESPAAYASQDEAVDSCALAARDEATRQAGYAEVREIGRVSPAGNGWSVTGTINERQNYRSSGHLRNFTCAFADGRVSNVSLD